MDMGGGTQACRKLNFLRCRSHQLPPYGKEDKSVAQDFSNEHGLLRMSCTASVQLSSVSSSLTSESCVVENWGEGWVVALL